MLCHSDYIGRSKGDPWGARLNATEEADPFDIQLASTAFKKQYFPLSALQCNSVTCSRMKVFGLSNCNTEQGPTWTARRTETVIANANVD